MQSAIASPTWILSRKLGWVVQGRKLTRMVKRKHLIWSPQLGVAYDCELYLAMRRDFDRLVLEEVESGLTYSIIAEDFDRLAQRIDRGHGVQFYLPLKHFRAERREGSQIPLFAAGAPT